MDPPIFLGGDPKPNSLRVDKNKIELRFDENITLNDQQNKVVVSPTQKEAAKISASGKRITIELRDTLLESTTYTIDFSNSIQDNNEGNPLDGFAYAFSTGDSIDTLQVSGVVLRARDLEPMQAVLVGAHSNLDDTAFRNVPFERIARTNSLGQFTLRNLKPGSYRVYALNDADRDYKFVRTEDLAFLVDTIVPTSRTVTTMDTLFTKKNLIDTIVAGEHTLFLPNDLLLSMFNEGYQAQYLKTYERPEDNKIYIKLAAAPDSMPQIEILRPEPSRADWYRLERSEKYDSLLFWIADSALIMSDSITLAMTYLRTDTAEMLSLATDTLNFVLRSTYRKMKEQAAEEKAKQERERVESIKKDWEDLAKEKENYEKRRQREQEEIRKYGGASEGGPGPDFGPEQEKADRFAKLDYMLDDTIPPAPTLAFSLTTSGTIDVYAPIIFKSPEPLDSINQGAFHVEQFNEEDSVWTEVKCPPVKRQYEWNPLLYMIECDWEPEGKYRITADTCAVMGMYGLWSKPISSDIMVKSLEEYSNLYLKISPITDGAFVELLDGSDRVVRTAPVADGEAQLVNLNPGEYYARIVIDSNGNGMWDTGNFDAHLQPEEVCYYPKTLKLKKNWDIEQNWNIYETAVDLQKPEKVKKNKPEKTKTWDEEEDKDRNSNYDEEDDEDWAPTIYTGNKYTDYSE